MPWLPIDRDAYLTLHRDHDFTLVAQSPVDRTCAWGLWVWHTALSGKRLPAATWHPVCRTVDDAGIFAFERWTEE